MPASIHITSVSHGGNHIEVNRLASEKDPSELSTARSAAHVAVLVRFLFLTYSCSGFKGRACLSALLRDLLVNPSHMSYHAGANEDILSSSQDFPNVRSIDVLFHINSGGIVLARAPQVNGFGFLKAGADQFFLRTLMVIFMQVLNDHKETQNFNEKFAAVLAGVLAAIESGKSINLTVQDHMSLGLPVSIFLPELRKTKA